MSLKNFLHSLLGRCGSYERLNLDTLNLRGCGGIERTDIG